MSFILLGILNAQAAGAAPVGEAAYDLLETTVLTSTTSSVTFSSLNSTYGSTYKHLQVRATARGVRTGSRNNYSVFVNGETGSVYSNHILSGDGSSVTSADVLNTNLRVGLNSESGAASGNYGAAVMDFIDAFDTGKNTVVRSLSGVADSGGSLINFYSGGYFNTAAIDSLEFHTSGESFVAGSRFSLYGLKTGA